MVGLDSKGVKVYWYCGRGSSFGQKADDIGIDTFDLEYVDGNVFKFSDEDKSNLGTKVIEFEIKNKEGSRGEEGLAKFCGETSSKIDVTDFKEWGNYLKLCSPIK